MCGETHEHCHIYIPSQGAARLEYDEFGAGATKLQHTKVCKQHTSLVMSPTCVWQNFKTVRGASTKLLVVEPRPLQRRRVFVAAAAAGAAALGNPAAKLRADFDQLIKQVV